MSSNSTGQQKAIPDSEDDDDEVPASQLTRPTPDAILADEADENALLGNETDSDAGSSRRDSFGSAADGTDLKKDIQNLSEVPLDVTATPTQANFAPKRVTSKGSRSGPFGYKMSPDIADLQAQIADLTNQVTGLNTKLVTSFMRVSDLEDDLSEKHQQISWHRDKVTSLEKEREEHLAALNTGLLVEKAHVTSEMQKMMDKIIEETAQRGKAVSDKEKIEAELDELSSSLFSEANKMVAAERLARARADEKSRTMEERLKDTEEIMEQQQKRLMEMQSTMEQIDKVRSNFHQYENPDAGGAPDNIDSKDNFLPSIGRELVRLDVIPYIELRAFLNHLRKLRLQLAPFYNSITNGTGTSSSPSPAGSRTASPAPINTRNVPPVPLNAASLSASSALSPFTATGSSRHKEFPNLPSNVEQIITLSTQITSISFLKRVNEEDCEPLLRLDAAPGLNWLSRRQMHASVLDGNLLIEPVFGGGVYDEIQVRQRSRGTPPAACAMCGKAVLNVPLPGGIVADPTSGQAQNLSATHIREFSGSPPASSSSFFLGNNNSTTASGSPGRLTQKKSSTGLLSTLRNIGAVSPRPSLSTSNSSSSLSAVPNNDLFVEEDQWAARLLPIPTHIFRISESSNRYLLCPDYCLSRLRVACNFWGYIRHLERAVVLEGKLAWDDEEFDKNGKASNLAERGEAKVSKLGISNVVEDMENLAIDDKAGSDANGAFSEVPTKGEEREDNLVVPAETSTRRSSLTISTDGEEGFADAKSVHSTSDQAQEEEAASDKEASGDEAKEKVVEDIEEEEEELQAAPTPTQKHPPIPPLPPRSATRRPVPRPPPALPPRKVSSSSISKAEEPESRRVIQVKGETDLTWEEKVWLEMLRHKADMWSARVGLYEGQKNQI